MDKVALKNSLDITKFEFMSNVGNVFLNTVLFSLKFNWDDNVPTACTNGINLLIGPKFWEQLTSAERVGLLWHEAWHVAFEHMGRSTSYSNFRKFNRAADYVINLQAKSCNITLPKGALLDSRYENMSTDEVYKLLDDEGDSEFVCDFEGNSGKSEKERQDIDSNIKSILVKAAIQSKQSGENAGNIPREILVNIDKILNPKLPWQSILMRYMTSIGKGDYSYTKPNLKYLPQYYLPSLHSKVLGEIAIAEDTSCSVTDDELAAVHAEFKKIKNTCNPDSMRIVGFDTRIHTNILISKENTLDKIQFKGRGGTALEPVFEYFNNNPPEVLIIFSDLECRQIRDKPKFPVVWVCINNPSATVNFGKLIHYNTPR